MKVKILPKFKPQTLPSGEGYAFLANERRRGVRIMFLNSVLTCAQFNSAKFVAALERFGRSPHSVIIGAVERIRVC
jgi:hypothetical protein